MWPFTPLKPPRLISLGNLSNLYDDYPAGKWWYRFAPWRFVPCLVANGERVIVDHLDRETAIDTVEFLYATTGRWHFVLQGDFRGDNLWRIVFELPPGWRELPEEWPR